MLPRPELGRAVGAPFQASLGHLGVEFEGTPSDGRYNIRRERRDRAIQPPLGNPAPGADRIGNHFDGERCFSAGRRPELIQCGGSAALGATNSTFQNVAHVTLQSALWTSGLNMRRRSPS